MVCHSCVCRALVASAVLAATIPSITLDADLGQGIHSLRDLVYYRIAPEFTYDELSTLEGQSRFVWRFQEVFAQSSVLIPPPVSVPTRSLRIMLSRTMCSIAVYASLSRIVRSHIRVASHMRVLCTMTFFSGLYSLTLRRIGKGVNGHISQDRVAGQSDWLNACMTTAIETYSLETNSSVG